MVVGIKQGNYLLIGEQEAWFDIEKEYCVFLGNWDI